MCLYNPAMKIHAAGMGTSSGSEIFLQDSAEQLILDRAIAKDIAESELALN